VSSTRDHWKPGSSWTLEVAGEIVITSPNPGERTTVSVFKGPDGSLMPGLNAPSFPNEAALVECYQGRCKGTVTFEPNKPKRTRSL